MEATITTAGFAPQPPIIRKPGKKPVWRTVLVGMVSGGLGAALAIGAIRLLGNDAAGFGQKEALRAAFGPWTGVVAALAALTAAWLAILAHEAGHVAGGLLARFRFQLLIAGPLRIERDATTERVRVGLNRNASLYGGIAASLPATTDAIPRRLALMVAGGPGASFLLAAVGLLLSAPLASATPLLGIMVGTMSIISGGLGVVTLIPMRFNGFSSDGARLLRLVRGGPEADREAAMLALVALSVAGTAPEDWPAETIRAVTSLRDGSTDECSGWLIAYSYELARGDIPAARAALHRGLELADRYPQPFVPSLMAEAAFFEGFFTRDAAAARAYLAEVPEHSMAVKPFDRLRAEAALALAEGDHGAARERIAGARAMTPAKDAFRLVLLDQMHAAASAEPVTV